MFGGRNNSPYPNNGGKGGSDYSQYRHHGGSGHGGRGPRPQPKQSRSKTNPNPNPSVMTNLFKISHTGDQSEPGYQWYRYEVKIMAFKGKIKPVDREKNLSGLELVECNKNKGERMKKGLKSRGSDENSRAVCFQLSDELQSTYNVTFVVGLRRDCYFLVIKDVVALF